VARPKWWGSDVSTVVAKKWQYSSMTAPGDPQLIKWPTSADPEWSQCLQVAIDALDGRLVPTCPGADSYFDVSIPAPAWAKPEMFVAKIGRLSFYNTDGDHPENGG
jgi:N-acetylmuramoyl-L-alanine amidase